MLFPKLDIESPINENAFAYLLVLRKLDMFLPADEAQPEIFSPAEEAQPAIAFPAFTWKLTKAFDDFLAQPEIFSPAVEAQPEIFSPALVAKFTTPCLNLELGSENTLKVSARPPTPAPTAAPIGPNIAPINAPLPAAAAIPIASSPADPFSIPTYLLSEEPLLALPVNVPMTPASTFPIDSLIPAAFFSSFVFPATWLTPVIAPTAISNGASILPPIVFNKPENGIFGIGIFGIFGIFILLKILVRSGNFILLKILVRFGIFNLLKMLVNLGIFIPINLPNLRNILTRVERPVMWNKKVPPTTPDNALVIHGWSVANCFTTLANFTIPIKALSTRSGSSFKNFFPSSLVMKSTIGLRTFSARDSMTTVFTSFQVSFNVLTKPFNSL